ncbi:MAG: DUF3460 family protein [Rhodocyclaceae bacterium]|nr:DUF3460 family protein [Rhodocyclaceae bacterium]
MVKRQTEYVSEFTQFMNEFLAQHPDIVADQYRGRAIYWDKQVDLDAEAKAAQDSVPIVDGYYYFGNLLQH